MSMIDVVNVGQLAELGYNLSCDINRQKKELEALKDMFRQLHGAGNYVYPSATVEISPATKQRRLQRELVEKELGITRLIEIGALIEVPVLPAVRFRR